MAAKDKSKAIDIHVRMSASEKAGFDEKAKSLGLSTSEFFRRAANLEEGAPREKISLSKRKINQNINWHLSRIGNNLNQLTYAINKARVMNKVNDALAKQIIRELMFLNIQINTQVEEGRENDNSN